MRRFMRWLGYMSIADVEDLVQDVANKSYNVGRGHGRADGDRVAMTLEQRNGWGPPPDVWPEPTPYKSTRN